MADTSPYADGYDAPSAPTLAGNVPDPDARVIDSLVESQAEPPSAAEQAAAAPAVAPSPAVSPPRERRLLTGSQGLSAGWDAFPLLPPDAGRESLRLTFRSSDAADTVRIADDSAKTAFATSSYVVGAGESIILDHAPTGPLWVMPGVLNGAAPVVTWLAVTK